MAKSRFSIRPITAAIALPLALPMLTPLAIAQQDMSMIEEVIVTARRRAESLQETPVAVTALDATALRDAGVRNLYDLNQMTPNIEVAPSNGNAPLANIYIRGVGQRNTGPNIDSGVGIYIDEVYIGRPDGALLDLNDVQSVQILRGPQGTLFGKNTTGGALVFTTNRPGEEFEGSLGARVGNYGRTDANFVLNVPLTDSVYTRLSGVSVNRDGFIDNVFDGGDYMDEARNSLIWQTRWAASDNLTLDLNVNWAETDQTSRLQKCVPVPGVTGWQAELFDNLAIGPSTGRTLDDFCQDAADVGDANTVISDLGGEYFAENQGASFTAEWDINENLSLKSISAWRYTEAQQDDELDHTAIPFLHRTQSVHPASGRRESNQYSQEFQLTGSAVDDRLTYVGGVFWFSEETTDEVQVTLLGPFDPAIAGLFFLNSTATAIDAENEAIAAFAQLEWEWSDNWRTTLGIRYTEEERDMFRSRSAPVPATLDANGGFVAPLGGGLFARGPDFLYNPDFEFELLDAATGTTDDSAFTPMASMQYLMDGNDLVDVGSFYLTYSQGFLSGGLSEAPTGDLEVFEPEEVDNIELGFKLDMFNRSLRVNGALFHADYTNRQLTTLVINTDTNSPAPATVNAASSTIQGFELETMWLPMENLLITFNFSYTEGDIDEFDDIQLTIADTALPPAEGCVRSDLTVLQVDSCPNDRSDENLPRLPKQSYLLAAEYTWATSMGLFSPRVQASLKTDIEYCFDSASCRSGLWLEDEQFELSARLTWISNDEKWVGALYGSNLTDEEYIVGGAALVESQGSGGHSFSIPRMYGAELQYKF